MLEYPGDISLGIALKWHRNLFSETTPSIAGRIRDYQVHISGTEFVPLGPVEVQAHIIEFFKWYSREREALNTVELAALAHVKFETVHPFGDGNGRVGRLIMNFILHKGGYPMMNIKYTGRTSYYNSLERSNMKGGGVIFVQWFFKRYLKDNGRYLKAK